ncbi:MAG: exonuclease [Actinobacteria bacterium HGW-Actinobacteria-7]|jgi:DNA polymerase-3 subunit epsilon|nr:MAG: exonuclease [Actinobacteria bacterium HGW-Actinobacteria-7]
MPHDLWVAIDFETASREATSACALGIALIDGLEIVETVSWLIRPPFNEYEYRNTLIHGITPEDTEHAPDFEELWWEIGPQLAGRRLLAHNAAFDMRVLGALIDSRDLNAPRYEYACTVNLARKALPDLGNHKLDTVCDHCGIRLMHHDAASDAQACARVALVCAETVGAASIGEAAEALGVATRRL